METKKIAIIILLALIILFGAYNWRNYFKEDGGNPKHDTKSAGSSGAVSKANATIPSNRLTNDNEEAGTQSPLSKNNISRSSPEEAKVEEEPPKRRPLIGVYMYDPFDRDVETLYGQLRTDNRKQIDVKNMKEPARNDGPEYMLELVLVDGDRRWALVNGGLYTTGDMIGGMRIKDIYSRQVVLEDESGAEKILHLSLNGS